MQGNGNPAGVVGAGGMGVRRVSLSSDSDVSGIEEADSQVGPQRSAASSAASSEPDVEMDPGAQFLEAIACPQSDFTYELDGAFLPKDGPRQECFDNRFLCVLGDPGASYPWPFGSSFGSSLGSSPWLKLGSSLNRLA